MPRIFLLIIDGFGVFSSTKGCYSTLGNLCSCTSFKSDIDIPSLWQYGLSSASLGASNIMYQDSLTAGSLEGHREMFGIVTKDIFPVAYEALPMGLISILHEKTGLIGISNEQGRGIDIVPRRLEEHRNQRSIIIYRGLDSVIVVTAECVIVPSAALYNYAVTLRKELAFYPSFNVKKVIAKQLYNGIPIEESRRDYLLPIDGESIIREYIPHEWILTVNQKVAETLCLPDEFAIRTKDDAECAEMLARGIDYADDTSVWIINFEDFDRYAHAGKTSECVKALKEIDNYIFRARSHMRKDDWLIITADHGIELGKGDLSTTHKIEGVPLLCLIGGEPIIPVPIKHRFTIIGDLIKAISMSGSAVNLLMDKV